MVAILVKLSTHFLFVCFFFKCRSSWTSFSRYLIKSLAKVSIISSPNVCEIQFWYFGDFKFTFYCLSPEALNSSKCPEGLTGLVNIPFSQCIQEDFYSVLQLLIKLSHMHSFLKQTNTNVFNFLVPFPPIESICFGKIDSQFMKKLFKNFYRSCRKGI